MDHKSVQDFYNQQYAMHREHQISCPNAIHDLDKARRRVAGVIRGFGISTLQHRNALDVGCGLGYYTKALSLIGAEVTGLDFSQAAIGVSQATFLECRFIQGAWPDDVAATPEFDLIWMVNFSMMNTFDLTFIHERLIAEAMQRLKPSGTLVVGWNSNFSGRVVDGWSHWPLGMLKVMHDKCGLSVPLVTEARTLRLSWLLIRCAWAIGRSIPIFMIKHKTAHEPDRRTP